MTKMKFPQSSVTRYLLSNVSGQVPPPIMSSSKVTSGVAPLSFSSITTKGLGKGANAKHSILTYEVIDTFENKSLIEITLSTGRFHQIRAQMAFIGHPIIGDKKYGAPYSLPNQEIALYACKIVFKHPTSKKIKTLF